LARKVVFGMKGSDLFHHQFPFIMRLMGHPLLNTSAFHVANATEEHMRFGLDQQAKNASPHRVKTLVGLSRDLVMVEVFRCVTGLSTCGPI